MIQQGKPRTTPKTPRNPVTVASLGVLLALLLSACGAPTASTAPAASAGQGTPAASAGSFPVDVVTGTADSTETVTIETSPAAIISLSPTATETLFAIGAGSQVKAVDDQSDYPADAPRTDLSGYTPNIEAILGYEPDLVVTSTADADLVASLAKAGVPTLVLPSAQTLTEAYGQIERLGTATGHLADAKAVAAQMSAAIDAAVASAPGAKGLTYFHELDPTLYTVSGKTFIGEIYGLFGLTSIADAAGSADLYPQLSEEYVVQADPDLIFLADGQCCGVTPETVGQRAGWSGLKAVTSGNVTVLDEDVASRWGPRVADFAQSVAQHVATVEKANA